MDTMEEAGGVDVLPTEEEEFTSNEISRVSYEAVKQKLMRLQEEAMEMPKAERKVAKVEIRQLEQQLETLMQGYRTNSMSPRSPPP